MTPQIKDFSDERGGIEGVKKSKILWTSHMEASQLDSSWETVNLGLNFPLLLILLGHVKPR